VNPQSDVDFLRIVNVPARGIGQTTVDRLTTWATFNDAPLLDALGRLDEIDEIAAAAKKKLASFKALMDSLRSAVTEGPGDVLERVLTETGYLEYLQKEDSAEADARAENLREFVSSVRDYEAEAQAGGEPPTLSGFLERVSLVSDIDSIPNADEDEAAAERERIGKVVLMTVHGAKGLEFENVFLTGMEEEMFPYKGVDPGEADELEEERRLAYVAITRARKHLVMTHTQMRQIFGTTRWNRPSRFLGELPPGSASQEATPSMSGAPSFSRYVERAPEAPARSGPWRHPQASARARESAPPPEPGSRYVDREFFDDRTDHVTDMPLRRGARVRHERFGDGEVLRIVSVGEPAVIAFFPGWGEKKILARFLKLA